MAMDMILANSWSVIRVAKKLFSWDEDEIVQHCLNRITFSAMNTGMYCSRGYSVFVIGGKCSTASSPRAPLTHGSSLFPPFVAFRKVLDKFCVVKNHKSSDRKKDAFYEILKERAASVLKGKGIDPVNDRGANIGRSLHYLVIFGAWLTSGYWHVKVRMGDMIGCRDQRCCVN